ncbi:cysteine desulfurase family protein [Hutsoniella sourekii]
MIYLDYAATTPIAEEVIETINQSLQVDFGNPSSIYRIGKHAKFLLEQARRQMADLMGIQSNDLYFTSGATEANNWAIRSQAYLARDKGLGNHLVASDIEHPSVKEVLVSLESEGFQITYLRPNLKGQYLVSDFLEASNEETIGWIMMAVNNEVGSILPVQELGKLAQENDYFFHVDTVQAMGLELENPGQLLATSWVGSAHKMSGPKGIGFLVYRPWKANQAIHPLIFGGGQESGKRSGTENLAYIQGMVKAYQLAKEHQTSNQKKMEELSDYFYGLLDQAAIDYEINGDPNNKVANIHNLYFPGHKASQLLIRLDLADIYVSAGSACSAGSLTPSRILQAYYPDQADRWQESLRLSFGPHTQFEELDQFVDTLEKILKEK